MPTMPTRPIKAIVVLLCFVVGACASSGEPGERGSRSNSTLITQEELSEVAATSLYEAVDHLRPRWLYARAVMGLSDQGQILVFMNRTYLGGTESLRDLGASGVYRIRYLDGPQAAATLSGYPSQIHVAGAIVVETSP